MRKFWLVLACAAFTGAAIGAPPWAAADQAKGVDRTDHTRVPDPDELDHAQSSHPPSPAPIFVLPKVGKPTGRLRGGPRRLGDGTPDIYVLVPDHVGYTTSAQPVLYWYLSEQARGDVRFELTLIDVYSVDQLLDERLAVPSRPGVQTIRLADHGVKLAVGEEYQWSVSLVLETRDRSEDVVSSGWIEVVETPKGMQDRLAAAGLEGAAAVYSAAGLWYETLDATYMQMIRNPDDPRHRQQLSTLLREVGLPETAADSNFNRVPRSEKLPL